MFAISNEELNEKPILRKMVICKMCGKRHRIIYGKQTLRDGTEELSTTLAFYKCNNELFLAGIDGRDIR